MNAQIRLVLIAVAAIVCAIIATVVIRDIRRGQNLSQGERLLQDGKLTEAETLYRGLYESNPEDPEAIVGLSEVARRKGDFEGALKLIRPMLDKEIVNSLFLKAAGWIYVDSGDTEQAIHTFTQLKIKDSKMEGEAALGLGAANLLAWQGRQRSYLEEASLHLNHAANLLKDDGRIFLWRAKLFIAQNRPQQAQTEARQAVALLRPAGNAYLTLGQAEMQEGKIEAAIENFEQALKEDANPLETGLALAQASYLEGKVQSARERLAQLMETKEYRSETVCLDAARLAILAGDVQKAKEILSDMDLSRGSPVPALLLVEVLARMGEYTTALERAQDLRRRLSIFAPAHFEEARLLMRMNRAEEARMAMMNAFKAAPELIGPTEGLGTYYLLAGDPNSALDYLDPIADQDRCPISAANNCILGHLMVGDVKGARSRLFLLPPTHMLHGLVNWFEEKKTEALAGTFSASPKDDWRYGWLAAEMLIRQGRPREAIEWLSHTDGPDTANTMLDLLRAAALAQLAQTAQAKELFTAVSKQVGISPSQADACTLGLAYCAWQENDYDRAVVLWSSLDNPEHPRVEESRVNLNWVDALRGSPAGSIRASAPPRLSGAHAEWLILLTNTNGWPSISQTRVFLQRYTQHGPALIHLARRLADQGDVNEAMDQINRAIELSPQRPTLYRLKAAVQYLVEETSEARNSLDKAAELAGESQTTAIDRAILALNDANEAKLDSELQQLESLGLKSQTARLKGLYYASQKEWAKAEPLLGEGIAADPTDADLLIAYGVCAANLGNPKEAEESIQDAIRLYPSNADAHRLLGQFYASRGLYKDAYQSFKTSLLLDAEQPDVNALVQSIETMINEAEM